MRTDLAAYGAEVIRVKHSGQPPGRAATEDHAFSLGLLKTADVLIETARPINWPR